jgi:hypothetical protein
MTASLAVGVLGAGAAAGYRSGATAGPVPGAPPRSAAATHRAQRTGYPGQQQPTVQEPGR